MTLGPKTLAKQNLSKSYKLFWQYYAYAVLLSWLAAAAYDATAAAAVAATSSSSARAEQTRFKSSRVESSRPFAAQPGKVLCIVVQHTCHILATPQKTSTCHTSVSQGAVSGAGVS